MTIGQRIAQKRKELGLSQEDLGERLGVSRQSIYKWEADQTLPEVEKLVRLSQLFSVTIGWLLGAEEDPSPQSDLDDSRELTPRQIQMVEDISERYIAAIPHPESAQNNTTQLEQPKRRRWPAVLACAAFVILAGALGLTAVKLGTLSGRHAELQNEMQGLQNEIDALNSQLDFLLESGGAPSPQAETPLLGRSRGTDWDVTITEVDYSNKTVIFDIWMRPSVEASSLNCQLIVTLDGEDGTYPFEPLVGGLTAQVAVPIAEHIELSVLFYSESRSELYPLTSYSYDTLATQIFPVANILGDRLLLAGVVGDTVQERALPVSVDIHSNQTAGIAQLRVGLFQDRELVMWYEESENSAFADNITSWDRPKLTLERGHIYCEAVVVTDEYGRERVYFGAPIEFKNQWQLLLTVDADLYNSDPENWSY